MRSPPKPMHSNSGSRRRIAPMRLAPCRSPLGSPALKKSFIDGILAQRIKLALRRRGTRRKAWQISRFGDLSIAQSCEDFQHFAPCGERSAVIALVLVPRLHEGNFVIRVVALAGGGVDLASTFAGAALFRSVRF